MADTTAQDAFIKVMQDWVWNIVEKKKLGEIPIISDIGYVLTALLGGFTSVLVTGANYLITGIINAAFAVINNLVILPLSISAEEAYDFFVDRKFISNETKNIIRDFSMATGKGENIFSLIMYVISMFSCFMSIMQVSNVTTQQNILEASQPMLPTQDQLLRLLFIEPERGREITDLLRKYGYDETQVHNMYNASLRMLPDEYLRLLYYRKILTSDEVEKEMMRTGVNKSRAQKMIDAWEIIPSIQDMLTMIAKEAFEPELIAKYTLDHEFPIEQRDWLEKQGLSDYWQRKYWYAHWDYPPFTKVLEMLYRGYLTEKEVYDYYKVVEIPPYWRDLLTKVSYKVYTRVDLRRLHAFGLIDDNELVSNYKAQGYDQEHAEKMALFTKKYNQTGSKGISKAEILKFYKIGVINQQDTIIYLEELGYTDIETKYLITSIDLQIEKEYVDEVIDSTKDLYINNFINTGEVFSRLNNVNITARKINVYIDQWDVIRTRHRKLPSKEDTISFFQNKIINEKKFYEMMGMLGYSDEHISMYTQLLSK